MSEQHFTDIVNQVCSYTHYFLRKSSHDIICVLPFQVIRWLLESPRILRFNMSPNRHPALMFSLRKWQPRVFS